MRMFFKAGNYWVGHTWNASIGAFRIVDHPDEIYVEGYQPLACLGWKDGYVAIWTVYGDFCNRVFDDIRDAWYFIATEEFATWVEACRK